MHSSNIAKQGVETARAVGLTYVSDKMPGFRRIGTKKVFRYLDTKGHVIKSPETLRRIARLAFLPRGRTCGSAPQGKVISRP